MNTKIVHMTSVHPPGDNRIFYKECTTLACNGYEVFLVVAGADSKRENGVTVIGFDKAVGNRLKRMIRTSFFDMLKACKKVNADIYHFHDPELIFAGIYLKIMGKKVIYDIHENNPASILSKPYIKSNFVKKLLSMVFDIFEKFAIRFFDALVTARPDISERFEHPRVVTLRNFPILPDFSALQEVDIAKTKRSVIFVGGMTQIRGINQLIDAFELLDTYELWLLGPITEENLRLRIQQGCKNVRYFGQVEAFEIFSYIQKADIGIITFLEVPNHTHTLATKPFEYMACGKPMIMSDFPYWRETFQKSAVYVDPSNSRAIADAVESLMQNKDLMQSMSELNKRLSITQYNWESESKKLLQLYRELAQ